MVIKFENLPDAISEVLERVGRIEEYLKAGYKEPSQKEDGLLTIMEAGKLICLSKNTIYKMVQKRLLPYCKRGKKLYFLKEELLKWIKEGKQKTEVELTTEAEEVFISKNKR